MKKVMRIAYFSLCVACMLTVSAFAYLDPSTTTALIQLIAGLAVAAGVGFGIFRHKIKHLFQKKDKTHDSGEIKETGEAKSDDMFD
ncbi:MAG: hypothetical protein FWH04_03380 [Oscillospiraceae bacterium]|nr:hypothetical protein [Oscillospiraceae bacterium]